jgi:molybdopterin molybdotransferase
MGKEFFKVLDLEQVFEFLPSFAPVGIESVTLESAVARILAETVTAAEDLPHFARSTVDGYAVRASSTFGASESGPALLEVTGSIAMGETAAGPVQGGQAVRIPTGGMLPAGADAVVMLEHADPVDAGSIEVFRTVAPGQNLIAAGEDFGRGQPVLQAGRVLRPQDAGVLAALGRTRVSVFRRPTAGIISTGDEIVPADATPGPAQVRDVNSHTLAGLALQAGAVPVAFGIVPDDFRSLHAACRRALECCDTVLISGGSSVGARDYTVEALSAFDGSRILVHGIALSPGKPTILARVFDKPVWGLPGHAASSMVVFARVVRPFLLRLAGAAEPTAGELRVPARLSRNLASAQGRTDFVRVRLVRRETEWWAEPILGKSGLLNTMIKSDGLVEIPKNVEGLDEGARVDVIVFNGAPGAHRG